MGMSKTKTKSINFSIFEFMKKHQHEMSFASRDGMTHRLTAMFKELHQLGYLPTHIRFVREKHIAALVEHWQEKGIADATIKNRMSDLRFVCRQFDRSNVIKSNDAYAIKRRSYAPKVNKAIPKIDLTNVQDRHLRTSLELQRVFGLRREECIKIIPSLADHGDMLFLQSSWTKGGIARQVPILTDEQRFWLTQAKWFAGSGNSLIPEHRSYIQQRNLYESEMKRLALHNLHGLRHAYAQKRYKMMTGWECRLNGGKSRAEMTSKERAADLDARRIISKELGHGRVEVARVYCG